MTSVLALTVIVFCSSFAQAEFEDIPDTVHEQSVQYTTALLRECPPNDCVLLSVGMTTTLLESHLRYQMKAADIADAYLSYLPFLGLKSVSTWTARARERWLSLYLPPPEAVEGKTIVLMRTLFGGLTMLDFIPHVIEHYGKTGIEFKLGVFFVGGDGDDIMDAINERLDEHEESRSSFRQLINDHSYYLSMAERSLQNNGSHYASEIESFHRYVPVNLSDLLIGLMSRHNSGRLKEIIQTEFSFRPIVADMVVNLYTPDELELNVSDYVPPSPTVNHRYLELDLYVARRLGRDCEERTTL